MTLIKPFVSVVLILSLIRLHAQHDQIYQESDLKKLLEWTNKDSIMKIERLAALKFHKLLNKYRQQNNLDTLQWSDVFWLTCRNHSVYMYANNSLTHDQKSSGEKFTGENPGMRLKFTANINPVYNWSGENALYNYSFYGDNIEQIAENIAKAALEQWQSSPGHNANMLTRGHQIHGVAFIIAPSGKIYATSLFGYNLQKYIAGINNQQGQNPSNSDKKTISKQPEEQNQPTKSESKTISVSAIKKELETGLFNEFSSIKPDNKLILAAAKHAEYLSANKTLTHEQSRKGKYFYGKTPDQRIARAQHKIWWFLSPSTPYHEYLANIEMDLKDYNPDEITRRLTDQLLKENQLNIKDFQVYGLAVRVKKKASKLMIWAVLII